MPDWRQLEAAVDRKIGRAFPDAVLLKFNRSGKADPERPEVEITAILHVAGDESIALGSSNDRFGTKLSAGQAALFIDRSSYDGPTPKVKDEVQALGLAGQPWFEVLAIGDRFTNLLVLTLGESVG